MKLDYLKETTPVIYGESSVRLLKFSFKRPNTSCFIKHWHERIEIILIQDGSMVITIDDETKHIGSGDMCIISPEQPHTAKAGENGVSYLVLMFNISDLENGTRASKEFLSPVSAGNNRYLFPIHDDIANKTYMDITDLLTQEKFKGTALCVIGKLYELFGILSKYTVIFSPKARSKMFDEVIEYIGEHFTAELTTKQLSERFGYSEAYFCRIFKKATGLSVISYINTLRLETACKYLKDGESITYAALISGFKDVSYFSKQFKAQYNMTPKKYRNLFNN